MVDALVSDGRVEVEEREHCEAENEDHHDDDAEVGVRQVVHRTARIGGFAAVAEHELEREDAQGEVEDASGDETDNARRSRPLIRCVPRARVVETA